MFELLQRVYKALNPPTSEKAKDALRFGILGAAKIAPMALILAARSHPEAMVTAVAARNEQKARLFAKKHGIEKVYYGPKGYQELIEDPTIDIIYNPLPNGLHYEWTAKALTAGKHVLLEKPSTCSAAATQRLFDIAKEKNVVLLEAFHYRFHPAFLRFMEIVRGGELGNLKSAVAALELPAGIMKEGDIRFNFDIGGGSLMDTGCYTISAIRAVNGTEPTSILTATHIPYSGDERIDRRTQAAFVFPNDGTGEISTDLQVPLLFGFIPSLPKLHIIAHLEGGEVRLFNFPGASFYHSITVTPKKGKQRVERAYKPKEGKGEIWWTTYRYQLEALVDKIKGRTPHTWITEEDSVNQMKTIEMVYGKIGLPLRPQSDFNS